MQLQANDLWNRTLSLLKDKNPTRYESFFRLIRPLELDGATLTLELPNNSFYRGIAATERPLIEQTIYEAADGTEIRVNFSVSDRNGNLLSPSSAEPLFTAKLGHPTVGKLNPKYTFSSFVVGQNTRFAHAAAQAVSEKPGKTYNPLFIYGASGLGKTHLMHAIGHRLLTVNPRAKVCYVSTEGFTNEVINGIRTESMNVLRERYRHIDLLLIDDIQFIERTTATQEEFFHTFNDLHSAGKQIVIASDRPPKEIPRLEERLRSRFEWGLQTDIQAPDFETRVAILRKKAEQDAIAVPEEVLDHIAGAFHDNVRELEGAFLKVVAYASLHGMSPDLELAQTILGKTSKPVTLDRIIQVVAEQYRVTPDDLVSPKRNKEYTQPRHIACYLIRDMTGSSFQQIGKAFDRDHTSVMHGIKKVQREIDADNKFAAELVLLKNRITSA